MSKVSRSSFKVCFKNQIHKISKIPQDLDSLKETIEGYHDFQLPEKWILQYTDSDGDPIIVSNEQDYSIFLEDECLTSVSIKIYVVPINEIQKERENKSDLKIQENEPERNKKGERVPNKSVVSPLNGKLKEKQRRLALKLIENLKRHDISKVKRGKMEAKLQELKINLLSFKKDKAEKENLLSHEGAIETQKQVQFEYPQDTAEIIMKPGQNDNHDWLSQQLHPENSSPYSTQATTLLPQKKVGGSKKTGLKKKVKTYFLKNTVLSEDKQDEEEDEVYEEKKPLKKVILQPDEKAMKLKEIFAEANLENLKSFTNEFPYLELDDLVENYIRF